MRAFVRLEFQRGLAGRQAAGAFSLHKTEMQMLRREPARRAVSLFSLRQRFAVGRGQQPQSRPIVHESDVLPFAKLVVPGEQLSRGGLQSHEVPADVNRLVPQLPIRAQGLIVHRQRPARNQRNDREHGAGRLHLRLQLSPALRQGRVGGVQFFELEQRGGCLVVDAFFQRGIEERRVLHRLARVATERLRSLALRIAGRPAVQNGLGLGVFPALEQVLRLSAELGERLLLGRQFELRAAGAVRIRHLGGKLLAQGLGVGVIGTKLQYLVDLRLGLGELARGHHLFGLGEPRRDFLVLLLDALGGRDVDFQLSQRGASRRVRGIDFEYRLEPRPALGQLALRLEGLGFQHERIDPELSVLPLRLIQERLRAAVVRKTGQDQAGALDRLRVFLPFQRSPAGGKLRCDVERLAGFAPERVEAPHRDRQR